MDEIIINDDDEDILEITSISNARPAPPSRFMLVVQELELLKTLCYSSNPIPLEYNKFYSCAKKVNSQYSDAVISSAWKRAIGKQVQQHIGVPSQRNTRSRPFRPLVTSTPVIVDLTEPNRAPSSSKCPNTVPPCHQNIRSNKDQQSISATQNVFPIALFVNPSFQEAGSSLPSDEKEDSVGVSSLSLGNREENCEGTILEFKKSESTDETSIEFNSKYESSSDSIDSGLSGGSRTKQKKRKHKDLERNDALADITETENRAIIEAYIGVQAKIKKSKLNSSMESDTLDKRKTPYLSKTELKLFKAEQKIQKLIAQRKLNNKQMEIVSHRLVDVIIPKYHLGI